MSERIMDSIRKEIERQGYDFDEVEMVDAYAKDHPEEVGKSCGILFRTKDGEHFVCGEENGDTKVIRLTPEEAKDFASKHVQQFIY